MRAPVFCDVEYCPEDATVEVDGRLRLNPGVTPPKWIAVEFHLCPEHEATHDKCHGEPKVRATKKLKRQP